MRYNLERKSLDLNVATVGLFHMFLVSKGEEEKQIVVVIIDRRDG